MSTSNTDVGMHKFVRDEVQSFLGRLMIIIANFRIFVGERSFEANQMRSFHSKIHLLNLIKSAQLFLLIAADSRLAYILQDPILRYKSLHHTKLQLSSAMELLLDNDFDLRDITRSTLLGDQNDMYSIPNKLRESSTSPDNSNDQSLSSFP